MKLKTIFHRAAAGVLCLLLCAGLLGQAAHASSTTHPVVDAPGMIPDADLNANCSLTITFAHSNVPVEVYRVASVDKYVRYTLLGGFASPDLNLNTNRSSTMWRTMAGNAERLVAHSLNQKDTNPEFYQSVLAQKLNPSAAHSGVSGSNGQVVFSNLEAGLYLIMGVQYIRPGTLDGVERNLTYSSQPYLVAVPGYIPASGSQEGRWQSQMTANLSAKMTVDSDTIQSVSVIKLWDDRGYEYLRPKYIDFQLLDVETGRVWPNSLQRMWITGNSSHTLSWGNLPGDHRFVAVEVNAPSYYWPSYSTSGTAQVITNHYTPPPVDPTPTPTPGPRPTPGPSGSNPPSTRPPATNPPTTRPPMTQPPVDIDDPDVPLGPPPGIDDDPPPDEIELDDPDVPLGDLPQTGQLWWPVPFLAGGGLFLMLVGLIRRRGGEYDEE